MLTAKTMCPRHREPVPGIDILVRTANPARRLDWYQRLCQWAARCFSMRRRRPASQRLDVLWDAQREQVRLPAADSYQNFIAKEGGPELRFAICHQLPPL